MDDAVRAHLVRRSRPFARMVGPLIVGADHLAAVRTALDEALSTGEPLSPRLEVGVVVRDLRSLAPVVSEVTADSRLTLAAVELAVPGRDGVIEALESLRSVVLEGVTVYVEPGWGADLAECVSLIAGSGHRLKVRTGGTTADAFSAWVTPLAPPSPTHASWHRPESSPSCPTCGAAMTGAWTSSSQCRSTTTLRVPKTLSILVTAPLAEIRMR